jgi:hypothetical protein
MRSKLLYFSPLSVPLKIVPRATLGTRAVGCRRLSYCMFVTLLEWGILLWLFSPHGKFFKKVSIVKTLAARRLLQPQD